MFQKLFTQLKDLLFPLKTVRHEYHVRASVLNIDKVHYNTGKILAHQGYALTFWKGDDRGPTNFFVYKNFRKDNQPGDTSIEYGTVADDQVIRIVYQVTVTSRSQKEIDNIFNLISRSPLMFQVDDLSAYDCKHY